MRLALVAAALVAAAVPGPATADRTAGAKLTVRPSDYGSMVWGPKRQAAYVFERDSRRVSRCYGSCARAWPPVFTKGRPVPGDGVRASLLGTTRRRGGALQVT